ncbi:MAG: methyltransferase domain-containing protein [Patescibacteria group bacterium]
MKTIIADYKNLEWHNFLEKIVRIFSVPLLNVLPEAFLRKFMRTSSNDAEVVLDNLGSARALEVMYGRYKRNIFSRGIIQGFADLFWHHFTSQPKGVRNRLKIVENNLDKEILRILKEKQEKEITIVTLGGGSARGIVEVLDKYSNELKSWKILVVNLDKSLKAIELGKELAKEFTLFDNFKWVNDLAQNVKLYVADNSTDIVEMVGLLDYFRDEKSVETFKQIYDILKKDGLFMVGNIVPNKEQPFILKLGWPKMYYRQAEDLSRLLIESGFLEKNGEIIFEPLKNHIVAVIKK